MEDDIQKVVDLITARVQGSVTNDELEDAVNNILRREHPTGALPTVADPESAIEPDEENYDDDDDANNHTNTNDERNRETLEVQQDPPNNKAPQREASKRKATPTSGAKKRGRPRRNPSLSSEDGRLTRKEKEEKWARVAHIPLGRQGSLMLTAFGDGKEPIPETIEKVLLGARRKLQVAIQDARHVRRQQKEIYDSFKQATQTFKQKKPQQQEYWTPDIMYRATYGYDPLAYDPKCGFDVQELAAVCPEEMKCYHQWSKLRREAEEKKMSAEERAKANSNKKVDDNDDEEEGDEEDNDDEPNDLLAEMTSHLRSRAEQFDLRTQRMEGSWYLRFADIRQGSFLPMRGARSATDVEWEAQRQQETSGIVQWSRFSAVEARFLHWLGFDPESSLPPPNVETTNALAFLGYSFFGDIVEKAIFLRNLRKEKKRNKNGDVDESNIILELEAGEQLLPADIDRSMADPAIKPVPVYSSDSARELKPQLYFGPGFESRLEMELDEILSTKILTPEELEVRTKEDELFAELAKPPILDGVTSLLDDDDDDIVKDLDEKASRPDEEFDEND